MKSPSDEGREAPVDDCSQGDSCPDPDAPSEPVGLPHVGLPHEPVDRVIDPLTRFLHIESASGIVLLLAAATALVMANSPWAERFLSVWENQAGMTVGGFTIEMSLRDWINDGLMTIFFFVVGLEVKRELVVGELNQWRKAALPIAAAVGGMLVPAGIYLLLQIDGQAVDGWGIPMATDIAFVVGLLAILKNRVPSGLRILVLSLAIADDIGAILVIAVGYTQTIDLVALTVGVGGIALVPTLFFIGVRNQAVYLIVMALVWLAFHESGVHATIAGVIFGLLTPTRSWVGEGRLRSIVERALCFIRGEARFDARDRYEVLRTMERAARKAIPPQERFENDLHTWSGFVIMPLFALANAGVEIRLSGFTDPVALAVMAGLVLGKPIGIVLASWLAVVTRIASLPSGVGWGSVIGGGCLAGIGFTMSLFIAGLALTDQSLVSAKIGILAASVLSALLGATILLLTPATDKDAE